jgi:uncharacterized protein (DUF2236 family)
VKTGYGVTVTSHADVTSAAHRFVQSRTSISWRINAERIVLLGWGRAILLQLAHPLVAAGVFDHSGFRGTPYAAASRLFHTVHAMLALTFGDDTARERTLEAIRVIHRRVNGMLTHETGRYPSGTHYSAEDPALVLWVHATLLESVILVYERLVAPLTAAERDEYCAEAFPIAVALAARENDVPRTWSDLCAYIDGMYATEAIVVGRQGRELAEAVLSPSGGWLVAPATWVNRMITVGMLPPQVREQYAMTWTTRHERTLTRLVSTLRLTRRVLPDAIALWPAARMQDAGHGHT